ncbi:MAG TPA: hypothetical protein VE057_26470 [Archangium sp.]|nr:hypothetical protein [Archangium sp.]
MDNDKTWTPPLREALWLTAPLTLEVLCEALQEALNVPPFEFDAENVYEWGISFVERGTVELNVSRKHRMGEPRMEEPFHILLLAREVKGEQAREMIARLVREVGPVMATATGVPVHHGDLRYVRGDEYTYEVWRTFQPSRGR